MQTEQQRPSSLSYHDKSSGQQTQRNQSHSGQILRLAPKLLELFPQRVMLNSRELATIVKLESSTLAQTQLMTWANEIYHAKPKLSLGLLLQQLTQRVSRWQASKVGERYGSSQLSLLQLETAFNELIIELQQAEAEAHDHEIKEVMQWMIEHTSTLKQQTLNKTNDQSQNFDLENLFQHMRAFSKEAQERLFTAAPETLKKQVYQKVQILLERESHRTRPQDFMLAQHAVWWSIMRQELNLPSLRLRLFDGW